MSEVLPFSEAEQRGHYADGGGDIPGQIPLTCRLQDTGNFYGSSGQGGGKRPPKLGQIGRSKRVFPPNPGLSGESRGLDGEPLSLGKNEIMNVGQFERCLRKSICKAAVVIKIIQPPLESVIEDERIDAVLTLSEKAPPAV